MRKINKYNIALINKRIKYAFQQWNIYTITLDDIITILEFHKHGIHNTSALHLIQQLIFQIEKISKKAKNKKCCGVVDEKQQLQLYKAIEKASFIKAYTKKYTIVYFVQDLQILVLKNLFNKEYKRVLYK